MTVSNIIFEKSAKYVFCIKYLKTTAATLNSSLNILTIQTGVVNWKMFTREYIQEYCAKFHITECGYCWTLYKDFAPGYVGNGQRGSFEGV
ncbi:UNVERIFIED_CONTAM: hypothetical protein FKN15_043245 [Acipenser sinensis]